MSFPFASFNRSTFRLLIFLSFATPLAVRAASDYLPDAATHLGTVVINNDDLYTTNPAVTLSIHALGNGLGITQMQFSNDDENWSKPVLYATSKQWQLDVAPEDFPPSMNTVLKTVYVRVKYGNGVWSKAFSDGIIFARSSLDVPIVQEVWIMQSRPAGYDSSKRLGDEANPYIIPPGTNEVAFDTLMNSLAKTYVQYRAQPWPWQTNVIPVMNTVTVMDLHIGPGIYQTHGDNGGWNTVLSWGPTPGGRIRGAGKDATTLLLVGGVYNPMADVIGNYGSSGMGFYNNLEISDLTADANMHENGDTTSISRRNGIFLAGNNLQLRRLRVQGFGSRIPGVEPAGMSGANSGALNIYNLHIEDCEVIAPQSKNRYNPLMIGYESGGNDASGNPYYWRNVVIRNNYINGLMYDGANPINIATNIMSERGSHGIGLGGCLNGIIEDNLVEHVVNGYYNEIYHLHDLVIRDNHFRNVIAGITFPTGAEQWIRIENNLVELDPRYFPASDYGWRRGFSVGEDLNAPIVSAVIVSNIIQFTDNQSPTTSLASYFGSAVLTGVADIENNSAFGLKYNTLRWEQPVGMPVAFYERQADIVNPDAPTPLIMANNRREDGSIIEVYPYFLDKTLPRPVGVPGETIRFTAPLIGGKRPGFVTGLPETNVIDATGAFVWTPNSNQIGRYLVSFYSSPQRTNDPRRTLITVRSGRTKSDPLYFRTGLKVYWPFSDAPGSTVVRDWSGVSNNIPVPASVQSYLDFGAAGHRAGQTAIHFKNTNPVRNYALLLGNTPAIFFGLPPTYQTFVETFTPLNQPFTISYWFKCDHEPTNNEIIFNYSSRVVLGVSKSADTNSAIAEIYCFYSYSPDLQWYKARNPEHIKITVGEWHHLVFVYDGLGTALYVDGVQRSEIPWGQLEFFDPANGIGIGGWWNGDNYAGSLSELAVWNRPLTAGEIADLFSTQYASALFPDARTIPAPGSLRVVH